MNSDLLIFLLRSQMSGFPELCMAFKEGVRFASLTDGRQTTQLLLTDNEPGNALEKQDGNHLRRKGRIAPAFLFSLMSDGLGPGRRLLSFCLHGLCFLPEEERTCKLVLTLLDCRTSFGQIHQRLLPQGVA
jgi:hypothetical protein